MGEQLRSAAAGAIQYGRSGQQLRSSKNPEASNAAGYSDVAPPEGTNAYCLPWLWRKIFPECFTLDLDAFFPFLFPAHRLVGRNHHSDADAEQTALIIQLMFQLIQGGEKGTLKISIQSTLTQWLRDDNLSQTGEGELRKAEALIAMVKIRRFF